MKQSLLFVTFTLMAISVLAVEPASKDTVVTVINKLADKASYSWTATFFSGGVTNHGKVEKGGIMYFKNSFTESFIKDDKVVAFGPNGYWQLSTDSDQATNYARFIARLVGRGLVNSPVAEAITLTEHSHNFTRDGDIIASDLAEDFASKRFPLPLKSAKSLAKKDVKGTVKFWSKDGVLSKYEIKVSGKVVSDESDREAEYTTTVEIKDVDVTKVEVPDEAKKMLEQKAAPETK